ncbi:MAG: hypothetical protein QG636_497 [Patescibacteria group bacterium]|jgi:hypothetical protein|nr:hypothetical protein [Patescibacteria group bacterium]
MGLNFSQKKLLSKSLHSKKQDPRSRRLRKYAFLTGLLSTLISLVQLIVTALQ